MPAARAAVIAVSYSPAFGWWRRRRRPGAAIERGYSAWRSAIGQGRTVRPPSVAHSGLPPLFSIVMPVHETSPALFEAAIGSVQAQSFADWQLCIADDGSRSAHLAKMLRSVSADPRVRLATLPTRGGIVAASGAALALATGVFVVFMDHDDLLACDALACMAAEIASHPDADMLFSDEDQLVAGRHASPYFKPGWNPELILQQNMVGHLAIYRRSLVEQVGGFRDGLDGSQDYDLALRASRVAREIRHVPHVLYHWRQSETSFSATASAACRRAARAAVRDHGAGVSDVSAHPVLPQWLRVRHALPQPAPAATIVMADGGTAPRDGAYPGAEVLHGDANLVASRAPKGVLVFLAGGLHAVGEDWLRELVSQAMRPDVGCVGGRLDGPHGDILHAGYTLDPRHIAMSLQPGSDSGDPGYAGHFMLARDVSAVSASCLAIRRDLFLRAGGFDSQAAAWASVDLCLRLAVQGLRTIWTPYARLAYAKPPPALIADLKADAFMRERWGDRLGRDPFANPNILVRRGTLALRRAGKTMS